MSEGGSPGDVNQRSRTPPPSSGQEIPVTTSMFSTPGGSSTGPLLLDFSPYRTPTPSLSGAPSPHAGMTNTPERVDLTLEGVSRNFLQLRHLLNQHVSREREKGVRIRLDYEESEPSLSLGQMPSPPHNSQPASFHLEAGPSVTSQPFNPSPYTYTRPNPTAFPLFTSQPLGHETTLDQIWQSPVSSAPPSAMSWEQAMTVLPLARSAAINTSMGVNQTAGSLEGFNLMPQMMAQMMAHVPWNQLINCKTPTPGGPTVGTYTSYRW